MEHADQASGLPGLDAVWDDVLHLEVDRIPDPDTVAKALLHNLDRGSLDAEHLADQRGQPRHRPALLTAEDRGQLRQLVIGSVLVDKHAETPVAFRHDLGRVRDNSNRASADIGSLNVAVS